ncbi:serine/arginine repetitive matrix protein 3 isoform X2 [Chelonia mydas]|uniref:serine/arginine repetitive matrix protein 3 isoform X2 n=1 Tax=Chelonia mydas TaxID=8469 RepID=UPI0018A1E420|nr:serine/arginine repetitive matrix protein 3 isoform X2 [Chelonia mydas]
MEPRGGVRGPALPPPCAQAAPGSGVPAAQAALAPTSGGEAPPRARRHPSGTSGFSGATAASSSLAACPRRRRRRLLLGCPAPLLTGPAGTRRPTPAPGRELRFNSPQLPAPAPRPSPSPTDQSEEAAAPVEGTKRGCGKERAKRKWSKVRPRLPPGARKTLAQICPPSCLNRPKGPEPNAHALRKSARASGAGRKLAIPKPTTERPASTRKRISCPRINELTGGSAPPTRMHTRLRSLSPLEGTRAISRGPITANGTLRWQENATVSAVPLFLCWLFLPSPPDALRVFLQFLHQEKKRME